MPTKPIERPGGLTGAVITGGMATELVGMVTGPGTPEEARGLAGRGVELASGRRLSVGGWVSGVVVVVMPVSSGFVVLP